MAEAERALAGPLDVLAEEDAPAFALLMVQAPGRVLDEALGVLEQERLR